MKYFEIEPGKRAINIGHVSEILYYTDTETIIKTFGNKEYIYKKSFSDTVEDVNGHMKMKVDNT